MYIDKLTIADVMERNVLYFDADVEDTCRAVCRRLGIYFLPTLLGDRYYTYSAQQNHFIESLIGKEQRIDVRLPLFLNSVRSSLYNTIGNVMFVYDTDRLVGIFSFADYHRPVVAQAITNDLSDFGLLLRQLLELHGKTERDVFEWLKGQSLELVSEERLRLLIDQLDPERNYPQTFPFTLFRTKELLAYAGADEHGPIYQAMNTDMKDIFSNYDVFERLNKFTSTVREAIDYAGSMAQYRWDKFGMLDADIMEFRREYLNLAQVVTSQPTYQRNSRENNKLALEQISQYGFYSGKKWR